MLARNTLKARVRHCLGEVGQLVVAREHRRRQQAQHVGALSDMIDTDHNDHAGWPKRKGRSFDRPSIRS
jgi:hypothetical protein